MPTSIPIPPLTLPPSEGIRPPAAPSASSSSSSGLRKMPRSRTHRLLELACKVSRASYGGIAFLSPRGDLVEHLTHGLPDRVAAELARSPWVTALLSTAAPHTTPCRLSEPELSAPVDGLPTPAAALVLPLTRPGRFRGALYLLRDEGEPFTAEDEEMLAPVAACLEEGNLFEEAHLLAQLRLLGQVAQAAAGGLTLEPLLTVVLRELDRHLPMSVCAVWLLEEKKDDDSGPAAADGEPRLVLAEVTSAQKALARELGLRPGRALPLSETPFGPCFQEGGAVYVEWGEPQQMQSAWKGPATEPAVNRTGRASVPSLATALRAGDRTVGLLQSTTNRPAGFTSEQVQMLYLVADLIGPAISNCQLYGRLRTTYEELRTTQQELIRSEKLRALGELASGMAHDFNNSLCGVLGFLEITLRDAALSDASRSQLELARTCALDAAQTVRRVQDFARIRRNDLTLQKLDVNNLVRETVELTRHRWESQSQARGVPIAVELRTEAALPILGNAGELREVLTNLIFNAVDAMPRGGTLTVRTWSSAGQVFAAVGDTGIGMGPEVRQRLFEPFFTTKGERGNGMGLSVAFGIIKQHDGHIEVDSEPGKGSTFTLRFPTAARSAGAPVAAVRAGPVQEAYSTLLPGPAVSPLVAGLRVLVVEDEEPICRLLETVLTQMGHRPQVVRSGAAAVRSVRTEAFDVVLTDLGLPDLSGEEVARAVLEHAPGTPVLMLTGWADQLKAEGKCPPGVTRVLGKPITIRCLAEALESLPRR